MRKSTFGAYTKIDWPVPPRRAPRLMHSEGLETEEQYMLPKIIRSNQDNVFTGKKYNDITQILFDDTPSHATKVYQWIEEAIYGSQSTTPTISTDEMLNGGTTIISYSIEKVHFATTTIKQPALGISLITSDATLYSTIGVYRKEVKKRGSKRDDLLEQ